MVRSPLLLTKGILVLLALTSVTKAEVVTNKNSAESLPCKAEVLLEPTSGDILLATNADEPLPPASMVKLMTTYVTLKQIKAGNLSLDDVITTSAFASKVGGSQVYLKQGEQFTLGQLLEAVMIQSANDAAVAIAEHVGGSREGFVDMMNAEAKALGMNNSEFHSPHGLPPGKDQEPDLVSAQDLGTLARALLREFPEVLEFTGTSEKGFRNDTFGMRNHNHLVRTFPGCDGLKTGYYGKAGFGVTATAQRKGVRVVAVLMGCNQSKARDKEAARLMSMGFSKYKSVVLAKKGEPAPIAAAIVDGVKTTITPVIESDVTGFVPTGEEKNVRPQPELCNSLVAPVAANTPCGHITYMLNDKEIARVNLVIPSEIPKAGFTDKMMQLIGL